MSCCDKGIGLCIFCAYLAPMFSVDGAILNGFIELPDISMQNGTKAYNESRNSELSGKKMNSGNTKLCL